MICRRSGTVTCQNATGARDEEMRLGAPSEDLLELSYPWTVKLVIADAHEGIKAAVAKVLHATWQRCRGSEYAVSCTSLTPQCLLKAAAEQPRRKCASTRIGRRDRTDPASGIRCPWLFANVQS